MHLASESFIDSVAGALAACFLAGSWRCNNPMHMILYQISVAQAHPAQGVQAAGFGPRPAQVVPVPRQPRFEGKPVSRQKQKQEPPQFEAKSLAQSRGRQRGEEEQTRPEQRQLLTAAL